MAVIKINPVSFKLWASDRAAFAKALGDSFVEIGFAVVSDHTIPIEAIRACDEQARVFFALAPDLKQQYVDAESGYSRGYSPLGTETAKGRSISDMKEFWHTGRQLPENSPYEAIMKQTPHVRELPMFTLATEVLYTALDMFGVELLRALAIYLGLDDDYFDDKVNAGNSILRLLHYPAQIAPPPEGSERAAAHEDINLITLLLGAEEAGLQAQHKNGTWVDINVPDGAIVVNAGDMLQRLTAWYIPSTTHRVLNPSPERSKFSRYSTPFFLHPNPDFLIDPLPQYVAKTGKVEAPITAGDYLAERLRDIGLLKK